MLLRSQRCRKGRQNKGPPHPTVTRRPASQEKRLHKPGRNQRRTIPRPVNPRQTDRPVRKKLRHQLARSGRKVSPAAPTNPRWGPVARTGNARTSRKPANKVVRNSPVPEMPAVNRRDLARRWTGLEIAAPGPRLPRPRRPRRRPVPREGSSRIELEISQGDRTTAPVQRASPPPTRNREVNNRAVSKPVVSNQADSNRAVTTFRENGRQAHQHRRLPTGPPRRNPRGRTKALRFKRERSARKGNRKPRQPEHHQPKPVKRPQRRQVARRRSRPRMNEARNHLRRTMPTVPQAMRRPKVPVARSRRRGREQVPISRGVADNLPKVPRKAVKRVAVARQRRVKGERGNRAGGTVPAVLWAKGGVLPERLDRRKRK
jgi:hypothetical protein